MIGSGIFSRLRSVLLALVAVFYYFLARPMASNLASKLSSGVLSSAAGFELVRSAVLLFLLLIGYAALGFAFQRQRHPLRSMGLVFRPCWHREFGIGAALGWGMMIACILPIALAGGLVVTLWNTPRQYGFFALNLVALALLALVLEVVFRGYFFQRFIDAFGATFGTIFLLIVVAVLHTHDTDWTTLSMSVALLAALLLSVAYLRTRALWVGWGFHFAWTATMAALFGLPLQGSSQFSSVIQSDARGPYLLTGGGYGPEAGFLAVVALVVGIVLMIRLTRGYAWQYTQPVIIPGGIPVDLDRAQQRQHELASVDPAGAGIPAAQTLVQIAPVTSVSPVALESPAQIDLNAPNSSTNTS